VRSSEQTDGVKRGSGGIIEAEGMQMFRRCAMVLAFVVLQAGIVVGISGVADATPALVGHVNCTGFSGTGKFGPGLVVTGSSTAVKITFKGILTGCTGGSIAAGGAIHTVTGGKVKGSGYFTGTAANTCSPNFQGAIPLDTVGLIKMKVKWTLSPAITVAPSNVKYGPGTYSAPTPPLGPMALDLGAAATPATLTAIGGSYTADALTQNTLMNIATPPLGCPVGPAFAFATGTMVF
jgi:hypothetical protein